MRKILSNGTYLAVQLPMTALLPSISIDLPDWAQSLLIKSKESSYQQIEARMRLAIEVAQQNITHQTGGPFGAVIFDTNNYQLISIGMNLVVPSNCSMAHAEMIAISSAQQQLQSFDLGCSAEQEFELVTSCEPCAMCFGAIPWSGVRHLVCGARDADARAIGFDEGPKMDNWTQALEERSISVTTDICRDEAAAVLQAYARDSGNIYNARQG